MGAPCVADTLVIQPKFVCLFVIIPNTVPVVTFSRDSRMHPPPQGGRKDPTSGDPYVFEYPMVRDNCRGMQAVEPAN